PFVSLLNKPRNQADDVAVVLATIFPVQFVGYDHTRYGRVPICPVFVAEVARFEIVWNLLVPYAFALGRQPVADGYDHFNVKAVRIIQKLAVIVSWVPVIESYKVNAKIFHYFKVIASAWRTAL